MEDSDNFLILNGVNSLSIKCQIIPCLIWICADLSALQCL